MKEEILMKIKDSFFYTIREDARDEDSISGNLLVRAGMIKKSSSGIYMIMPLGKRVLKKIEEIVRDEMDKSGAQELLMPALIPQEIYESSGRREAFGSNMFTLKDRYDKTYVLGPTHEELFTIAALMKGKSYKDFPYNLYQIQTKFRDETRPRYGLIRVREFIMKDAYSFDLDEKGLALSYEKMFKAYQNIMKRCDLTYKIVDADTGAMGGNLSQEFQAITDIGEDVLITCNNCDFASNVEVCEVVDQMSDDESESLKQELVATPNVKTIEEVSQFLKKDPKTFVKTLIYRVDQNIYAFLLRGDRELNESKALKIVNGNEMWLATSEEVMQCSNTLPGFVGPMRLHIPIIMDQEILHMKNFVTGANQKDHHMINVNVNDFEVYVSGDIVKVNHSDVCPRCKQSLTFCKGIEVGNTFKLGSKYAQTFHLEYLDQNNQLHPVMMGCYGFGLERCLASIVEQHHDDSGILWPMSVAPYQVAIIIVSMKDEQQVSVGTALYHELQAQGIEVILDDRDERVGVKFKDMELIGIPYRITIGRSIIEQKVEFRKRSESENQLIPIQDVYKILLTSI